MGLLSRIQEYLNRESKKVLLLSICFLTVWGLWLLTDAYGLFCKLPIGNSLYYSKYIFNNQIYGIILGILLFIVIQKFIFDFTIKYPWVFLLFSGFCIYYTLSDYTPKYLHIGIINIGFRTGLLVTFLTSFYFITKMKLDNQFSKWEITGDIIFILLVNFFIAGYGDSVMAFFFTLSSTASLYFVEYKRTSIWLLISNFIIAFFITLTHSFSRNGFLETYFGEETFNQVTQSIKCFLSGGILGIGPAGNYLTTHTPINDVLKKLNCPTHLPDFQEGFIFSSLGLQYGFIGVVICMLIFLVIIYLGLKAVVQAKAKPSAFLVLTATTIFSLAVFIGMATPLKILPPNGEGIPLFSAGMNRTLFAFFTFGLIYKNLDPDNDSPNHLSINTKVLFLIILLLYLIIPLSIIYYHLKWSYSGTF